MSENYLFISNGIFYTYKYDNQGSYVAADKISVANDVYGFNVSINSTSISLANSTANLIITVPTVNQITDGNYYLNANGSWSQASGGTEGVNTSASYTWTNNHQFITTVTFGNSVSNATVNSTVFTGTSNNTLFVGNVTAANVVSNAQLQGNLTYYQTTAGLSSNVAKLTANTANNANFLSGNSVTDLKTYSNTVANNAYTNAVSYINSKSYVNSSQLSANLSNYQTISNLPATVAQLTANNTSYVGTVTAANVVSNSQLQANLTNYTNTALLTANLNTTYSNATSYADSKAATAYSNAIVYSGNAVQAYSNAVSYVTAQYYVNTAQLSSNLANYTNTALLTANLNTTYSNATAYVDGKSYVNTSQLSSNLVNYATLAGLSSNVITLTANNTNFVGTVTAANVVSNAQLQANLANYTNTALLTANLNTTYSNATSYTDSKAATAYSNAIAYAASNTYVNNTFAPLAGANFTGAVTVSNNLTVTGNLTLSGNTVIVGANNLIVQDAVISVHTQANLAPWTTNDGKQIGVSFHYYNGADSQGLLVLDPATTRLNYWANSTDAALSEPAGTIQGTIQAASFWAGNNTVYSIVNATNYTGTANNSLYLGGLIASGYQTTAGLNANIASYLPTYTGVVNAASFNVGTTFVANTTTLNANGFTVNSSIGYFAGNVGIGTSSPAATLDVRGQALGTTAGNTSNLASFHLASGNDSKLVLLGVRNVDGTDWSTATTRLQAVTDATNQAYIDFNPNSGTYGIAFGTGGSGTPVERLRIASNGNIGIGNTTPANKLAINGTTYLAGNLILGNSSITVGLQANGSYGTAGQVLATNGTATYWISPNSSWVDVTAQYTWTNTQTFTNTITFNSTINGTANNALYLGGVIAASYVQNTDSRTLSGNLVFTGSNITFQGTKLNVSSNAIFTGNVTFSQTVFANGSAGAGGQVLTSNGSGVFWGDPSSGAGSTPYYYYNSNTDLVVFSTVILDTSNGSVYVNLPASPYAGAWVKIGDGGGNKYTYPAYITRNGSTIEDSNDDLAFDMPNFRVEMVYTGTTWKVFY
jgi:hypothetical protein